MDRFWLTVFLTMNCLQLHVSNTFILPLKKTNGSLNVEHLLGHMTLLEQTITSLQQTVTNQGADIVALQTEVSNLKTNQQKIVSSHDDVVALKTEIANLKANQQMIITHHADISTLQSEVSTLKANQQTIARNNIDIASIKSEIANLKANQQTTSPTIDIAKMKSDILNLKTNQRKLDKLISDLQKQAHPGPIQAEVTSLKAEVNATKIKVTQVVNGMVSLTSKFNNLTQNYQTLHSQITSEQNVTRAVQDILVNVHTEVNATKSKVTMVSNKVISLTSKFNNLTQEYQSLSSLMKSGQNITKTVHAIQETLGRVLSHEDSSGNDRLLLHSSVNSINKTVSELNSNWTVGMMALSAEIAQLKTEVGFEIWIGSFTGKVHASMYTTVKFNNIHYNIGNGYNSSMGVFTAPVSGTYLFWTQVEKLSGAYLELLLRRGRGYIGGVYMQTQGRVSGSMTKTVKVQAGEQVYVDVIGADYINCCYTSWFGGTLLHK